MEGANKPAAAGKSIPAAPAPPTPTPTAGDKTPAALVLK